MRHRARPTPPVGASVRCFGTYSIGSLAWRAGAPARSRVDVEPSARSIGLSARTAPCRPISALEASVDAARVSVAASEANVQPLLALQCFHRDQAPLPR